GDEAAGQKIEPNGLAMVRKRLQGVHCREVPESKFLAICDSALCITLPAMKPNFCTPWCRCAQCPDAKRPERQAVPRNRGQSLPARAFASRMAAQMANGVA